MEIIGVIIAGIIIGLLGKFVAPSNRDNIPLWLTIVCGIGGVFSAGTSTPASAAATPTGSTGSVGSSRSSWPRSWS